MVKCGEAHNESDRYDSSWMSVPTGDVVKHFSILEETKELE